MMNDLISSRFEQARQVVGESFLFVRGRLLSSHDRLTGFSQVGFQASTPMRSRMLRSLSRQR